MNKTSIIIVTFNSARTIKACLNSVIRYSSEAEIIVVDNNSEDQTIDIVKAFGNKVKLANSGGNLGFAKANNLGVKSAGGDYLIFLNPDTKILEKGSLEKLKISMELNPEYGIIGPKLIYPDGTPQDRVRNLPTIARAFNEYFLNKKGEYDFYSPDCKSLCEVESIIGACIIIRKELFKKIGGFDEKYFMYYEDLELCRRVRELGFKVGFLPEITIEHAEGKSGINQKTSQMLNESAQKYHSLVEYFLIQLILRLSNGKRKLFWALIIFLGAAFFRIFFFDLIEFKADEAITTFQTVEFYLNPYLIQRGLISGIGVYNFPLFSYLIIILAIFSRDPQYISFLIALINTMLVPVFYIVIRKYYDQLTAIFAGFLLAFSPWAIIFSRKIWAQDLILLLALPFFALIHGLIIDKKTKFTLPIFTLLVLLSQLHASGFFLSAATVLILIILRVKINFKQALMGICIGAITTIPYIAFQLSAIPICPDCDNFFRYQNLPRPFDLYNLIRPFQLMNGQGYHFVLGNSFDGFLSSFPLLNILKYFFLSSFVIPFIGAFFIISKRREYLFLVLYLTIIPILYFITRTNPYMHYFVILIPMVATLYAFSFSSIYNFMKSNLLKTLTYIVFIFFISANIIFVFSFNQYLSSAKIINGDYGPIFSLSNQVIKNELKDYRSVSYYNELESFAYIFLGKKDFHLKLAEFFKLKGNEVFADIELRKNQQTVSK
ncbi:MAG: glycosyltransferase [Microgenomates group bacterium]|jgi:hypothetical protein